jgi:hypothetical protein
MQKIDQLNYLSIELLEQLGNRQPSQAQIDLVESILSSSTVNIKINFSNNITPKGNHLFLLGGKWHDYQKIS